jgi:hypothetical protein
MEDPTKISRIDQLRDRIQAEGGIWNGKRAWRVYQEIGFDCTLERARVNLRMTAEKFPNLLEPVKGERDTWETKS